MNPDNDKLNDSDSEKDNHTPPEAESSENISDNENTESNNVTDTTQEEEFSESHETPTKTLFRSKTDRIFFGVCSGLGKYFDTDPLFFRLAFIISIIFGFWGILFYLILGIIIPEDPSAIQSEPLKELEQENHKVLIGSSLILLGIFLIVRNTRLFQFFQVWSILADYLVPIVLIIAGLYLLFSKKPAPFPENEKLYRSSEHKKIAGVCSGLGEYFNTDPTIIRILWLVFVFSSFGLGVLIYLLFVIVVPEKQDLSNEKQSEYN